MPICRGARGELLVRRRLVEAFSALELMRRCHLIEQDSVEDGLVWRASDDAASFVGAPGDALFTIHLKTCAEWLGQEVRVRTKAGFKAFVREEFGDWSEAFSAYGGGTAELS